MKTLYLECAMGAAGDMLTAALLSLLEDSQAFIAELNALGLPDVKISADKKEQYGITGLHMHVLINGAEEHEHFHGHYHEHEHRHVGINEIRSVIDALPVSEKVKNDIYAVYDIIAGAESKVHGKPMELVHFHEVGALDAIADITAVCMLMERIGADKIVASPIHLGSGTVRCAHGVMPVPAPAVVEILRGVPCYGGDVRGELCTPTGAALIRHFAREYGSLPLMSTEKIGVGIGTKDFGRCNCLRAFLGTEEAYAGEDSVCQLSCNIDDMSGEALGYASEKLFEAGAADVFFAPVYMKKSRPAYMLSCICRPELAEEITMAIFRHTSTIGVRSTFCRRSVLQREEYNMQTSLGTVRIKRSAGYGVKKSKIEFEDLRAIAQKHNLSLEEALAQIEGELEGI